MQGARRHRHLATWLGILAMLVLGLVPTVSRVLAVQASADHAAWTEICGINGLQLAAHDEAEAPPSAHALMDACVYCSLIGDGAPAQPLPLAAAWTLHVPSRPLPPVADEPVPVEAPRWLAARPRAPPVLA